MDALRSVIAQDGLSVPSYDAIAGAGGMSRQLVRHYYRAGDEMAADLASRLTVELRDQVQTALRDKPREGRIDSLLDALFAWDQAGMGAPDERNAIECALHTMGRRSHRVRDAFAMHLDTIRHLVKEELGNSDTPPPNDASALADAVVAFVMARNLPGADVEGLRAAAGRLVHAQSGG